MIAANKPISESFNLRLFSPAIKWNKFPTNSFCEQAKWKWIIKFKYNLRRTSTPIVFDSKMIHQQKWEYFPHNRPSWRCAQAKLQRIPVWSKSIGRLEWAQWSPEFFWQTPLLFEWRAWSAVLNVPKVQFSEILNSLKLSTRPARIHFPVSFDLITVGQTRFASIIWPHWSSSQLTTNIGFLDNPLILSSVYEQLSWCACEIVKMVSYRARSLASVSTVDDWSASAWVTPFLFSSSLSFSFDFFGTLP